MGTCKKTHLMQIWAYSHILWHNILTYSGIIFTPEVLRKSIGIERGWRLEAVNFDIP